MTSLPSRTWSFKGRLDRYKRTVKTGLKSLWLHRLRSLLTMLGIVFGVSSVIAMLAVGEGASFEAHEQIRQQGSDNIILTSVKPPEDDKGAQGNTYMVEYGLTYTDIQRIQETAPAVRMIVPSRIIRKKVWNVGNRVDCDVVGTIPQYPPVRNHGVAVGRFFTETELDRRVNVCVLGAEVVKTLFPLENAVGRAVRIGSDYYRVIGIMEPLGGGLASNAATASDPAATTAQNRVYIPLSAAKNQFGEILVKRTSGSQEVERVELHEVTVAIESMEKVVESSQIVGDLLERNHKKKDYEMIVPLQLLRQAERTARIFNIVLGAIAAISLLVGGIGIMNIMLASVTERTREIGVRRALGAKRRDIVTQFLVETVMLAGAGGVLGVVLGMAIPYFITAFAEMETIVVFWSPVLAFSISAIVGVIFGIYPALRAAHMDPVEALRHE